MVEEFEWKQWCLEGKEECAGWEEEHYRHEEELHEMRRKKSRQQEQMNMAFWLVLTGIMSYWGMMRPHDDKDPPVAT